MEGIFMDKVIKIYFLADNVTDDGQLITMVDSLNATYGEIEKCRQNFLQERIKKKTLTALTYNSFNIQEIMQGYE